MRTLPDGICFTPHRRGRYKFDEEGLAETLSKFFGTVRNVYNFFVLYSNQDELNPASLSVPYAEET